MKARNFLMSTLLAATALLTACAGGPAYKDMQATIPAVPSGEGRVYFYRTAMMGAAVQPDVHLNGKVVGSSVPGGFFYADEAPGNCEVVTATEVENKLTFTLDAGQTRYVRLDMHMGLMVGHVVPHLIDETTALTEIDGTKYAAPKTDVAAAKP